MWLTDAFCKCGLRKSPISVTYRRLTEAYGKCKSPKTSVGEDHRKLRYVWFTEVRWDAAPTWYMKFIIAIYIRDSRSYPHSADWVYCYPLPAVVAMISKVGRFPNTRFPYLHPSQPIPSTVVDTLPSLPHPSLVSHSRRLTFPSSP